MKIELAKLSEAALADYGRIPISFEVRELLDVDTDPPAGFRLTPRPIAPPYVKDYDCHVSERPAAWPGRFDTSQWILVMARSQGDAIAENQGCEQLKVETQNTNVPACRFYARQGCVLRGVHHRAYADCPDEVQLLWYKELTDSTMS